MADAPNVIGPKVQIRGSVSGDGDLQVEGRVDGNMDLKSHLIVSEGGEVDADVKVNSAEVHGDVKGQLDADEVVVLHASSTVQASIRAPRVVIEDGANFSGQVEMDVNLPNDI